MNGKLQPQDQDAEKAVLAALLTEKDALTEVVELLKPDDFYHEKHQAIYLSILDLFSKSEPIDLVTTAMSLRQMGKLDLVGGMYYISELSNCVNSSENIKSHAMMILDASAKRKLIDYASQVIKKAYDVTSDGSMLMEEANFLLNAITGNLSNGNSEGIKDIMRRVMEQITASMDIPDGIIGVPSGFDDVDKTTGGWRNGDLIILAARPGMGKTAFVVNCMRNAAIDHKRPIAFFSLEMSVEQLVTRMITSEVDGIGLTTSKLGRGRITKAELETIHSKIGPLAQSKVFLDDAVGMTITSLRSKAIKLKRKHNIEMIIIDYLQLMDGVTKGGKGNREQEISGITRGLKTLAKELDIPIIALSQLSREVERRSDKKPMLSDLRESGSIEQDADVVMFLFRPEYYKIMEDENGNSLAGLGELIIAKHRNGAMDNIFLRFVAGQTKFKNMNDEFTQVSSVHSMPSNINFYEKDEEAKF